MLFLDFFFIFVRDGYLSFIDIGNGQRANREIASRCRKALHSTLRYVSSISMLCFVLESPGWFRVKFARMLFEIDFFVSIDGRGRQFVLLLLGLNEIVNQPIYAAVVQVYLRLRTLNARSYHFSVICFRPLPIAPIADYFLFTSITDFNL